ncbi:MAG: tRNA (adenosine(37)-N6)-threonylcarbamoyltransferase complex dimerization subunit type 1 TsaB [Acidimicrobiales bacterium mtb01]|nr:tRNA (adenosine(37)-N6)-threonylcarbamoyltransferase complex dimerization subunit type 1 TsaB [Actinomycetota bacterium]TEX47231.1 MAG: tRNA (adenosine(37)-N6)-threonylcarbamoyltransferase complex dimerization subunit type 1 TsaB [Acidimicrobiales bacterium mtb01]
MIVLGIETATPRVSVALANHDGVVALIEVDAGRRHAETLVPAIEFACRHADVTLPEIGVVAVDVGPGLFTGMRVGIATAKSLAQALEIPVVPLSSLEVLAHPLRNDERVIVSVIDARKGEIFYGFFRAAGDRVVALAEPRCGTVDELVSDLVGRQQSVVCVGDGARRYREQIVDGYRCDVADAVFPSAASLVAIGDREARIEKWVDADDVAALYLRKPDAEINWSTRESA